MSEQRDYYSEALRIIKGTTLMVPEREHLLALAEKLTKCAICGNLLEESVSASDGVNKAVKVCVWCSDPWEEHNARP